MAHELLKRALPKSLQQKLRILKYLVSNQFSYAEDGLYTLVNASFLGAPDFNRAYAHGKALMQKSWGDYDFRWRAYTVLWAARQAMRLEGDFVECGVNTGMNARMIMDYTDFSHSTKKYYLLDTFQGMSEKYSTKAEMIRSENMGYTQDIYDEVKKTFSNFPNAILVKGAVPETLTQVPSTKVALLHIDMNCVVPEVAALEFFWDKMVSGGFIILDDFGFPGHEDQRSAHVDFALRHGVEVLPLPTGQGIIIKQ